MFVLRRQVSRDAESVIFIDAAARTSAPFVFARKQVAAQKKDLASVFFDEVLVTTVRRSE